VAVFDGTAAIEAPPPRKFALSSIELVIALVTLSAQGSLFWLTGEHDFLFVGVRQGRIVVSFTLGGAKTTLTSSSLVNDGLLHNISLRLINNHAQLFVDRSLARTASASPKFTVLDGIEGPAIGRPLPLLAESQGFFAGELHALWFNGDDLLRVAFDGNLSTLHASP
jgi:hypothetical protein